MSLEALGGTAFCPPLAAATTRSRTGHEARQLQLHHDHVDQGGHRWAPGLNNEMRRFPVERIAQGMQFAQAAQRISHLQQRPVHVMAQAPKQFVGRGIQVNHLPPFPQVQAVGGPQHYAATGRQHAFLIQRELVDDRLLDIAESIFPLPLEVRADGATDPLLNHMVGIKERQLQPPGELPPDGGFTGAGQADQTQYQLNNKLITEA